MVKQAEYLSETHSTSIGSSSSHVRGAFESQVLELVVGLLKGASCYTGTKDEVHHTCYMHESGSLLRSYCYFLQTTVFSAVGTRVGQALNVW